jgi:hypothetical protein
MFKQYVYVCRLYISAVSAWTLTSVAQTMLFDFRRSDLAVCIACESVIRAWLRRYELVTAVARHRTPRDMNKLKDARCGRRTEEPERRDLERLCRLLHFLPVECAHCWALTTTGAIASSGAVAQNAVDLR